MFYDVILNQSTIRLVLETVVVNNNIGFNRTRILYLMKVLPSFIPFFGQY